MAEQEKVISWEQVGKHITPSDCWVVVDGRAYSVTDFLVEHPGGDEVLLRWSGLDSTEKFNQANHSQYAISLRNARFVGKLDSLNYPPGYEKKIKGLKAEQKKKAKPIHKISQPISLQMVKSHKSEQSCWIIIENSVYDVTNYLDSHPGGVAKIMDYAGKNATDAFEKAGHSLDAIKKREEFRIGTLAKSPNHLLIAVVALVLIALVAVVCTFY